MNFGLKKQGYKTADNKPYLLDFPLKGIPIIGASQQTLNNPAVKAKIPIISAIIQYGSRNMAYITNTIPNAISIVRPMRPSLKLRNFCFKFF